ncbi:Protein phosphatase 1 regulatory subunit 7 [Spathaspora sp. JA1]|nr:Protein phosphatase 1 regulatory subunit 7 [Spathaspora sp. JA1]
MTEGNGNAALVFPHEEDDKARDEPSPKRIKTEQIPDPEIAISSSDVKSIDSADNNNKPVANVAESQTTVETSTDSNAPGTKVSPIPTNPPSQSITDTTSASPAISKVLPVINKTNPTPIPVPTIEIKKINRLVLLYDKPRYYHTIIQLKELRELPNNYVTVIEIGTIDKVLKETTISSVKFDHFHMSIEYNDQFESNLGKFIEFLKNNPKMINEVGDIAYHIHFEPGKKWKDYKPSEIKQYYTFLQVLKDTAGDKVVHCSVVNKYDMDTVYITEKAELTKLGNEIQQDIQFWNNLKTLDYGESSIRFLPGVKLPDTLEVLNIGGGYALETLTGFKMPPNLRALLAGQGAVHSIDNITFPATLERLEIEDNKIYFLNYVEFPTSLKHLDVSQNRIESLRGVNFPRGLQSLNIGFNPIETIRGIKFPESLRKLEISNIPNESMTGVKFPEMLDVLNIQSSMTNTRGLKLPQHLKTLVLTGNGVNSINPLKLPDSIEVLYLNQNNIKTLNKVHLPPKLRELYLGDNLITTLKNVTFPNTLEVLDLENDPEVIENDKHITTLKDVLLPPNLKIMKLGYHAIKAIESYEFPTSLRFLSLAYNELRQIKNIKFGNHLKTLDLSGNPELLSLDNVIIPESVTELRISPQLIGNLPAYIIERANKNRLIIKKSAT